MRLFGKGSKGFSGVDFQASFRFESPAGGTASLDPRSTLLAGFAAVQ
jgi:hypothetical protein